MHKIEFLNQVDVFFANFPEENIAKIAILTIFILLFWGFKNSNYSIDEFKENMGIKKEN